MTIPVDRVVIAGGSGFLGVTLAVHLMRRGMEVVVLSRRRPPDAACAALDACGGDRGRPSGRSWRHVPWSGRQEDADTSWHSELDGARAVVNLAGRSVNCVKTPDHCDEILRSRVESTAAIGGAVRAARVPPPVWVQMSTAHIYGDPPETRCDESSVTGVGLAPTVGRAWEEAFDHAAPDGVRRVILRTGFVIGRERGAGAGAMQTLGLLARLGLGGAVGSGRQGMSWIHEIDFNRIVERAIREPSMQGIYIVSAPNPVSQRDFMRELRRRAGGLGSLGIGLPAFAWMVRIGAPLLLRTDPELALYGRYVVSRRLAEEGFEFSHPHLPAAMEELFSPERSL